MLITCQICGTKKKAKRKTTKFCSLKCSGISQKGKRRPHTKEWEENRLRAIRKAMENKVFPRGYKRPESATRPMLEALKKKMIENPEKYREIAIRNLSKNKSMSLSKENSPQWLGGKTAAMNAWRNENRLKLDKWAKEIKLRDNNKCRLCGSVTKIEAHHILSLVNNKEFAFMPCNGVTLCRDCHTKTENFGGRTRKKLESIGKTFAKIVTIPHKFQEYETCGNYATNKDGSKLIMVSDLGNRKYEILVAIHELIESVLVADKVKEEDITAFDIEFEKNRKEGDFSEPGMSPEAPYHHQHMVATAIEMLIAEALGVDWSSYEATINKL